MIVDGNNHRDFQGLSVVTIPMDVLDKTASEVYANEILLDRNHGSWEYRHARYETDLLVNDIRDNGDRTSSS